jgi:hypothetical protein
MDLLPSRPVLERLADTLWAERHVVELLLYKLTAARLFLAADERRFVPVALDEVERVVGLLRDAEQRRTDAIAEAAEVLGVPVEGLTLTELAAASPEPLRSVFADHRKGFLSLAAEIEETAATNRRLATAALSSVREALDTLTGPPMTTTYTAAGRQVVAAPTPLRLDRVM